MRVLALKCATCDYCNDREIRSKSLHLTFDAINGCENGTYIITY